MSEHPFWGKARAFCEEHDTATVTITFEADGMVWRDDQGRVIPQDAIPDWMEQAVLASGEASVREMAADIRAAQLAHPEDWDERA